MPGLFFFREKKKKKKKNVFICCQINTYIITNTHYCQTSTSISKLPDIFQWFHLLFLVKYLGYKRQNYYSMKKQTNFLFIFNIHMSFKCKLIREHFNPVHVNCPQGRWYAWKEAICFSKLFQIYFRVPIPFGEIL